MTMNAGDPIKQRFTTEHTIVHLDLPGCTGLMVSVTGLNLPAGASSICMALASQYGVSDLVTRVLVLTKPREDLAAVAGGWLDVEPLLHAATVAGLSQRPCGCKSWLLQPW